MGRRSLPANVTPNDVYQTPTSSQPGQPLPSLFTRATPEVARRATLPSPPYSPPRSPVRCLSRRPANASRPAAVQLAAIVPGALPSRFDRLEPSMTIVDRCPAQAVDPPILRPLGRQLCLRTAVSDPVSRFSPLFTMISTVSPAISTASNFCSAHKCIITCGRVFTRCP